MGPGGSGFPRCANFALDSLKPLSTLGTGSPDFTLGTRGSGFTDFSVGARRTSAASGPSGSSGTDFALDTLQAFGASRARRSGGARNSVAAGGASDAWNASWSLGTGSTSRARGSCCPGFTWGAILPGSSLWPSWASMRVACRWGPVAAARRSSSPAGESC